VSFEVPNRGGVTVQISGRAANVRDEEAAYELSPLTRWRISGSGNAATDTDVPGAPIFGLLPTGQGTVEAQSIAFTSLQNTGSISAGTLTLAYWDELSFPTPLALGAAIADTDTTVNLTAPGNGRAGSLLQIDAEIMLVESVANGGLSYQVTRGSHGTSAAQHDLGMLAYDLTKKTFVLPFVRGFFGSPASGSYAYPVYLPDARVAAAELFMTNSRGNSDVTRIPFTSMTDFGLRTLSGGQLSIQVEGMLAIQTDAAPPISIERSHSVRDVYAIVGSAPTGSDIVLQVNQNSRPYCGLRIKAGLTVSDPVDGFALGPLEENLPIALDITSVTATSDTVPGSDLTVIIRL